ncbi:LuxR family transcriptional regulator [Actinomadura sp. KC216]|uniref:LuxR C-terminal-related transcriptional regulator n=1 Tax=Actinomadura sp. KC216 TaxID=2530370 RepID=UPI001042E204|nr:LuxR C-terminal-related transcriptional regulator [Actinomadura sp. KC216]TDB88721.1 LuxR family transcriptional regulator [Actinomadura sp. KC216]
MASRSAKAARTLPADLTSFVGRRHDLVAVRRLFSVTRLVTLTGMGGVGKTRLALQAAGEMRRAFPDGVFLVELASLKDPHLLPQTLIDALDVHEQPALDPVTALCEHLERRTLLLILDNCEHLVEATADLVDPVLRAAPDVRILATSRHAMRIAGEHIYPVPPLLAPDPGDSLKPGTASRYPSVALFADRAAAVVPGFATTPENEAAVVRLCHRLEGIPLAIELAAVRLRVLTVDELAGRLDDRFQLLQEGNRNLPERHRTLQSLIDWSYDLCTPIEQLLWARSSVFAGGFTGDALEAVCTDDLLPGPAVLDTLARLVDKSILIREEHGGHARFRMLDTLREYGHARLAETGDDALIARRHRDWYARLIETAGREWVGPHQEDWAARLQREHANLRHALEYCMSIPGEARVGLRMAAVPWFWGAMDHLTEARLWLDRGLALDREPSHERAWALATTAYIAAFQGDHATLSALSEQARDLAVELDDLPALAFANHVLGFRQSLGGSARLATAIPLFGEALAQYARTGLEAQYAQSLLVELAATHIMLHEFDRAAEVADELYDQCASAGERWNLSYALWLRGLLSLVHDDPENAERRLFEALQIKRVFRDNLGLALTLEVLAWTAAVKGEAERAAVLLGGTDRIWRTLGARQLRRKRERYEAAARAGLGDDRFDAALARGSALSIEETLAFGLREPRPEPPAEPGGPAVRLTPREQEVAALVAEGMSNKEIAAKLVISLRTAEGHVEKVLSKQGFKTRAQIATWVTQRQADRA